MRGQTPNCSQRLNMAKETKFPTPTPGHEQRDKWLQQPAPPAFAAAYTFGYHADAANSARQKFNDSTAVTVRIAMEHKCRH
jgi:hypothetical protein